MFRNTIVAIASCAGMASVTLAGGTHVLADANSTATFDTNTGQVDWLVDGVNQLFAQEFYFRRANDTQELGVNANNLNLDGIFTTDTNPFSDNNVDALSQLYSDGNGLQIETIFTLRGGTAGSANADLAEQIIIRNNSNASMSLSFFQFVDFDLGGDFSDDSGDIINGNTARQFDNDFSVSETVVTPSPTAFQMGNAVAMSDLLNDGNIDNLDGTASGIGDVGWAFQWDFTLAAGEAFIITKDKSIVPAPASMLLLGAAGLTASRRRRS
ncbi:MAG: PEP-CTERM sorting domain-containing protein [Phycisphaerales bacterium]|nr:PEP-CTERM sorting domain-containing protein [Phycisphaerales bacterium]